LANGLATQMLAVAIGWQVYAIHRNPLDLGLVGLAEFVPLPLLALPAGHLADRASRRLVLAGGLVVQVAIAALLLLVTLAGAHTLWPFLAIAALAGVASGVTNPAGRSLTPEIVPPELLQGALALRSVASQIGIVAGPALGGDDPRAHAARRAGGRQRRRADVGEPRRGAPLHPSHADAARADPARPLRRAARRPDRARAGLRSDDPRRRADRTRRAPGRAVGRRPACRCPDRAAAADASRRSGDARGGRDLRRSDDRVRRLALAAALARGALRDGLRRHGQRQHPPDCGHRDHAARAAGARQRSRVGLHQRLERAGRVRGRRGCVGAGDGARGRARRRADGRDRVVVAAPVPGAVADGPAPGAPCRVRRVSLDRATIWPYDERG